MRRLLFACLCATLAVAVSASLACAAATGAPAPSGRHPDPLGALSRCHAAFAKLATAARPKGTSQVIQACSEIIVERGCREALRRFASVEPAKRAVTTARRCRDVYCPLLPAPRPALCTSDFDKTLPTAFLPQWKEFSTAVLRFDLGPQAESASVILSGMFDSGVAIPVEEPLPREQTAPTLTLLARPAGQRILVDLSFSDGQRQSLQMQSQPTPDELTRLGTALRGRSAATRVTLQMDRSLSFGTFMAFMDVLRSAGLSKFAFSVEN